MSYENIKIEAIQKAFSEFYETMLNSEHFKGFFGDVSQIDALIDTQAKNFHASLTMSEEDFIKNNIWLGQFHAQMNLPFVDMVSALEMVRDSLIQNTDIDVLKLFEIIQKMQKYIAKGYILDYFEHANSDLNLFIDNIKTTYLKQHQEIAFHPITWLQTFIAGLKDTVWNEHDKFFIAEECRLTRLLIDLNLPHDTFQLIQKKHHEQHALAANIAYFYNEENYSLAKFMFDKMVFVSLSLSSQIGIALAEQSIHELKRDTLTGALTRNSLEYKIHKRQQVLALQGNSAALIMLDIDHFKAVNDEHGHLVGDEVLRKFSQLVLNNLREDDILFRYGGEEFLLFAPNMTAQSSYRLAERIREEVANVPLIIDDKEIFCTVSIGSLHINHQYMTTDIEELIKACDSALYKAKHNGRNQVEHVEFVPTTNTHS